MAVKVRILEDRETLTLGIRGEPVRVRRIEYAIGSHGPFIYETPITDWTQEKFQEAVKVKAEEIKGMESLEV